MWRWTLRILVALSGFLILAAVCGATWQWLATRRDLASTPPPGRLVDIGGHRLHLWCMGAGAPAVIIENCLVGSSAVWGFVQPDVARFTRVCSYDRAGAATAIQARRLGQHAASRASSPNSSIAAASADRWSSSRPPAVVSMPASSHLITPGARPVLYSWMPHTRTKSMRFRGLRDLYLCSLQSASFDCSAFRSA
jgi:hypothetical protein